MSNWTHIQGIIDTYPIGRTQEEMDYILKTVLKHLPVIQGWEGELETYIVVPSGHDEWCSCDEFGMHTNNLVDHYGSKNPKGGLEIQSKHLIIVNAHLRARDYKEIYKEFQKWLCRLAKRILIGDCLIKIYDDYNSSIITDNGKYINMYETENNWTDYLMWKPVEGKWYPKVLKEKYAKEKNNGSY